MEISEIKVGEVYRGISGCTKKVLNIENGESKAKTVTAVILRRGTGRGNHRPVGTVGRVELATFAVWAVGKE